ncbi:MAG: amino acid adenylation domain-containing protein, partial [Candidatus Aminicenantes bacterium]
MNTSVSGSFKKSPEVAIASDQAFKEKDYWMEKLAGEWVPGSFPYDNRDKVYRERRLETLELIFADELFSRLMIISKGSDPKLHMILVAGLAVLLYKYTVTGNRDIVICTSIDKQGTGKEFINTILPLRIQQDKDMTFKQLLLLVMETINEALENQNYPIEVLIYDDLGITAENESSLMDVALILENIQDKKYIEHIGCSMVFSFLRTNKCIEGIIEYDSCRYMRTTIERIASHFIYLLRQAVFNVDLRLTGIDLLSENERKQILFDFNKNRAEFPLTKTIDHFIRERARKTPDHVAAEHKGKHLTYTQFNKRSGQLAHRLRGCGIAADERVGIIIERSPLLLEVILGIWKAGGSYIPIEIQYPKMRMVEILKDSAAKVLLAESRFLVPGLETLYQGEIIDPDLLLNQTAGPGTGQNANSEIEINMTSMAYVIYTSGSTGRPKGVMVEHIGMMNHIHAKINDLQLTAKSIVAQNSSYTFDISIWQFFAALTRGGKTIIYPYTLIIEPTQFIQRIIQDQLTVLEVVPSYLSVLLDALELNPGKINSLEYLLVTGEEVKHRLIEQWLEKFPHIKMVNAYGPTEASDDITHYIMDHVPDIKPIPIGQPLQNMDIYIVDENMKLCPLGFKGEICVSGIGVGRGYLNDQNKTAQAFIRGPFPEGNQERNLRLYKTGDLGTWLPDGNIRFFGRKDHQVKIRGYRIELGEIEWNLMEHQSIKEAVVIDRKNPKGIQSLCAYLVPRERLDMAEIKEYLLNRLPDYMVPDYFIELDRVPLTSNGKIDRKALSEIEIHMPSALPFISGEMLKNAIHSTSAREKTSHRLSGEETERLFNKLREALEHEHFTLQECREQAGNNRTYYPLSYPQRMMYYIEKRNPGTGCNNVVYTVKYPEETDGEMLEQAINHVLYKNEALRLRIIEIEHESSPRFVQYVSDYKSQCIDRLDFSGKNAKMSQEKWLETDARKGFDLLDNDLFYFAYIKFNEKTSGYYVKLHHIICDAVSIHFIFKEINKIYQDIKSGKTIDNKPNPSYLQYIAREQAYLKSSRVKEDMEFWLNYILPPPEEVHLSPRRGETGNPRANISKLLFPRTLNQKIYEYCKNNKTTPYRLILAALSIYISRACAVKDIVIGTLNNNRSLFQYIKMFGIFIGFVPLRIHVQGNIGFNDFIKRIGRDINRIINNHQEFPFEILAAQLGESIGFDHRYFSNINLISHPDLELKDFAIERHFSGFDTAPLSIYINRANKGIHGLLELDWVFRVDQFLETEIEQIHYRLANILADALANPVKKVAEIELVSMQEKEHILDKFSRAGSLPKIDIPLELSDNHVIYILDETGMMQPVGIPGELAVGPEASRGKEEEIYLTGELARWLPNGNIEQLGRIEYQVRIKGIRIDLQKIENHLLSFSGVEEAVVVKKYNRAVPYLCAFIALKKNLTESELKEYMSSRFSPYMIPKHFVQLEKMPLTGDGSLDRELLERIDIKPDMEMEHLRPRNETEEKLAEIWADVLGVEKNEIGINSSFFELGGHSLNATILASKIHREFNVKISLAEIFRAPDIVRLSEYINGLAEEKYESIQPAEKKEYYELSSAQKRLYILQQMELNSSAYNLPRITVLEGELDKKTWEETLKNLLKRHESLMTSFHMVDDEPVQKIHDHAEFKVRYFDLKIAQVEVKDGDEEGTRGLAPLPGEHATRNPQSATALISSFIRPFDLSQAPLLRVGLIKIREKKHLLMLDMHHIISDALSHPILINDFGDVYAGKDLPPLRLHYKDFSQWQNNHKQKEILTQQKEYWLKTFADDIPVLNLPLDYARPGYQNFEGSTLGFELGTGETQALNQLAMKENTTLYVVLLAIFHLLLSKISGQEKHVIGSPIIGRKHADLEKIVGIFLNTLALKNQVEDNRSFIHLLQQVEENTLAAFENQDYPFEELVEQLPLERDVSRNPLFDVMFSWLKRDYTSNIDIPGVKLMPYEYEIRISKFDLELYAVEAEGKLLFTFEYCTKLFKQETIERFIYYFKKIISSILIAPGIKILDIEIISEEEKKQILFDFNDTDAEYPQDKTIHELVAEQLERTSDKIAVIGHGGTDLLVSVSYRELNQRANRLARVLNSRGIQRDDPVGIVMERSQQMVESIMAIWKAGGAYIPIDPGYPHERIDHMLSDSQAKVLVTRQDLSKDIKFEKEIIYLSEPINRVPTTSHLHLSPVSPAPVTSLAYIIYTSGSTGKPRGVMIEHIGMMNHIQAKINDLRLTENSIVAQNAAHTFDISVWQFFAALILGGKTIIYPDELIMDPRKFLMQLVRDEVTILEVVPSYLSVLLDEAAEQSTFPLSLHYLLVTGEEIKPHLVRKWFDQYPGIKMVNAYGPTEASDDITHYIMDKAPDMERIPIGKPLQNMNIYIVDKRMQLCPIGVKGEICVSGVGVGRGYIGDKAKTKQVFIKNPFFPAVTNENSSSFTFTNDCSPQLSPNNRLYKTGDMGTWLPDGTIEFFGRKDYQVKIRGFRIELGEIENRLLNHPEIKEAVVIDREDQVGNKFLCAYVVPDSSNLPE